MEFTSIAFVAASMTFEISEVFDAVSSLW